MLRTCFKMFPEKVSSPAVFCLVFQIGLAYLGKWKTIRELMWMRSYEDLPSSERDGIKRNFYFHQWYEGNAYRAEVVETLQCMVDTIASETGGDADTIRTNLTKVFEYNADLNKREFGTATTAAPVTGWRKQLQHLLPRSLIKAYRHYRYRNTPPAGVLFAEQAAWLKENGITVNEDNIECLQTSLEKYYKNR